MSAEPALAREPSRGSGLRRCAALLALLAASACVLALVRDTSREHLLGSDEPEWMAISVLHVRQLVEGGPPAGSGPEYAREESTDPVAPTDGGPWTSGVQRTTFGYMNPCLAKLVWGTTLRLAGHGDVSPLVFQSFHRGREAEGERARAALLPALPLARRVVLVFATLTAALVFLVVGAVGGARSGLVAGGLAWALWLATPLVHRTASYLRTDYFMLTFLLATLLAVWAWREVLFDDRRWARRSWAAALVGLLIGLTLSSKLNGSMAAMGFVLAALLGLRARARDLGATLTALLAAGLVAALVFVVLQPVTWQGPFEGVREVLARWERHTGFIQDRWAPQTGVEVVRTPAERVSLFARALFGRHEPLAALSGLPLGAPLALLGLVALAARGRAGRVHLAFFVVLLAGTALSLPIDWERLYLPALVAVVSLEALGLAWAVEWIVGRRARRDATG